MNEIDYITETNTHYIMYIRQLFRNYGIETLRFKHISIRNIFVYIFLVIPLLILFNITSFVEYMLGIKKIKFPKDFLKEIFDIYGTDYRVISHITLDNVPPIKPCDETRDIPEVYEDIITYDPPFGYEQGFNHQGIRYDPITVNIPIEGKYTVEELSEYVNVLIWSGINSYMAKHLYDTNNVSLSYFGNVAYVSLYHSDQDVRDECLNFLKYKNVLKSDDEL